MPRMRYDATQIRGGGQKERTFVPGMHIFNGDRISDWLDCQIGENPSNVNLTLLRDKHAKWLKTENGNNTTIEIEGNLIEINTPKKKRFDYKREHLEDIIRLSQNKHSNYEQLKHRHFLYDTDKKCFILTTSTRLLVGFSGGSIFENSLSLHRLYGFPIIPGSTLKGIAHHFCDEYLDSIQISDDERRSIFGIRPGGNDEGGSEGDVVFMDAWPNDWPADNDGFFELDIFNPHYKNYYKEGAVYPTDNQLPVPNIFLAVRKDVKFEFGVKPSSKCGNHTSVEKAKEILEAALKTFGVGAKTGSSYGYFI